MSILEVKVDSNITKHEIVHDTSKSYPKTETNSSRDEGCVILLQGKCGGTNRKVGFLGHGMD